jgi:uncharacterized membrane protein
MNIIALIALGAGLFVGSRFEGAHDTHQRFSSYRVRTNASLGAWIKRTIMAGISVVALILLLYQLLFHLHVRCRSRMCQSRLMPCCASVPPQRTSPRRSTCVPSCH